LVFSATISREIESLVHTILNNPVTVQITHSITPAVGIRHAIYPVPRHLKTDLLVELLRNQEMTSVLVFTRTKHYASRLSEKLERRGFKVSVLHGDRSQNQRLQALDRFRQGKTQIMVATDIAARGIDIDDISHVINFDIPNTPEDYIHRIGRTARAEATGDAFTLVDRDEEPMVKEIEHALKQTLPRVTLPDFDYKGSSKSQDHHPKAHQPRHHQAKSNHRRHHSSSSSSGRRPHHKGV
jgi:ATP-dependent RNA helicase RhlE